MARMTAILRTFYLHKNIRKPLYLDDKVEFNFVKQDNFHMTNGMEVTKIY